MYIWIMASPLKKIKIFEFFTSLPRFQVSDKHATNYIIVQPILVVGTHINLSDSRGRYPNLRLFL